MKAGGIVEVFLARGMKCFESVGEARLYMGSQCGFLRLGEMCGWHGRLREILAAEF